MFLGGYAGDKAENTHKRAVLERIRQSDDVELGDVQYLPYPGANHCVRRYETKVLTKERGDRLDPNRVVFVGQVPNLLPKSYVAWAIDTIAEEYALDFFLQTARNGCAKAWLKTPADRDRLIARNRAALFDIRGLLIARTTAARDLLVEYTENISRYNPTADTRVPHQCLVFEKPRHLAGDPVHQGHLSERMPKTVHGAPSLQGWESDNSGEHLVASRCLNKHPVVDTEFQARQEENMERVLRRQLEEQLQQVRLGVCPTGQPRVAAPVASAGLPPVVQVGPLSSAVVNPNHHQQQQQQRHRDQRCEQQHHPEQQQQQRQPYMCRVGAMRQQHSEMTHPSLHQENDDHNGCCAGHVHPRHQHQTGSHVLTENCEAGPHSPPPQYQQHPQQCFHGGPGLQCYQFATYLGTLPNAEHGYALDQDHVFETGRPTLVRGNIVAMLQGSGLAEHFQVSSFGAVDRSTDGNYATECDCGTVDCRHINDGRSGCC